MRVRQVLSRRLLAPAKLEEAVKTYEALFKQSERLRFDYAEKGLTVVQVGQVLLIAGEDEALKPFRETDMTFLVDDIAAFSLYLPTIGGEIIRAIQSVPSGRNMLVRHADESVVEYVQHDRLNTADDTLQSA